MIVENCIFKCSWQKIKKAIGNKYNLNVKNVELIKTKENGKPYIVLVRCIKNSKLGIKVNSEKNIGNLKTYQNMFKEELWN